MHAYCVAEASPFEVPLETVAGNSRWKQSPGRLASKQWPRAGRIMSRPLGAPADSLRPTVCPKRATGKCAPPTGPHFWLARGRKWRGSSGQVRGGRAKLGKVSRRKLPASSPVEPSGPGWRAASGELSFGRSGRIGRGPVCDILGGASCSFVGCSWARSGQEGARLAPIEPIGPRWAWANWS